MLANFALRPFTTALVQGQRAALSAAGACADGDSPRQYVPRRALLYVPASNPKMLSKVAQIKVSKRQSCLSGFVFSIPDSEVGT